MIDVVPASTSLAQAFHEYQTVFLTSRNQPKRPRRFSRRPPAARSIADRATAPNRRMKLSRRLRRLASCSLTSPILRTLTWTSSSSFSEILRRQEPRS